MLAKRELHFSPQRSGEMSLSADPQSAPPSRVGALLRSIWRRRGIVIVLTALALLPAVLYVRLATPLYTSTAELLIRRTASSDRAGGVESPNPLSTEDLAAQREVLTSTPVLAAALAMPGVQDCSPLRDHHDPVETLNRSLIVETRGGGLMSVSIVSTLPDDATCIVSAVVQAYSQFLSSLRRNGNADALAALSAQRAKDQAELARQSADLLHFGEEHHVGAGGDLSTANDTELASLSAVLNQAHLDAVQAKAADEDLKRSLDASPELAGKLKWYEESLPASARVNVEDEDLLKRELLALKASKAQLDQKFMPGHPTLVKVQQGIDQLELEHDAAVQRKAVAAQQHEADVQRTFNDEQKRILDQNALQAEYTIRSKKVAELQAAVDEVSHRINGLDLADNSGTPTATILNPAKASTEPTSPDRQKILPLAAAIGLVFSCLLACFLERGRMRIHRGDKAGLSLPLLGELPSLPTDFGPMGRGQRALAEGGPVLGGLFGGLRAVVDGAKMRMRGTVVLLASPSRGDGKSVLASNLAVHIAQSRKRVLLIDANFRAPALARIFGLGNATGLATLLEAEISIPITAIHHTSTASLDVIPTGPLTRTPGELLNSQRFIDLIGDLSEQYDYVLIDSPPSVTFSDARIISASCDVTMMVVRTDQLNRRSFEIAREGLTNVGANLCGVILNSGMDQNRSDEILMNQQSNHHPNDETIETLATRKLGGLVIAAARAVDLVRAEPTNRRVVRQRALPGSALAALPSKRAETARRR